MPATSGGSRVQMQDPRRALPSVEQLLQTEPLRSAAGQAARAVAVKTAQDEIERVRAGLDAGNGVPGISELAAAAAHQLERSAASSLGPVINATGVIVHTNLGRAPLAAEALEAIVSVGRGYSNLEYDLDKGTRGSRHAHVESLLCELTGAEAAFAVNNNAAGVLLALGALALDREVVISRGQLVEIGGSFRIPDILAASGARLVEVGTTNRTRLDDYTRAVRPETAALMRVHCSNFRTVGFTEEVEIEELCALGEDCGLPVIDDLGSGLLTHQTEIDAMLADEPPARRSVAAGAAVVCFSGDKLLGGPQAGIVVGRQAAIERMRTHPLARAVRLDKLSLAALEATLHLHREPARAARHIPVLAMLSASEQELSERAGRLRDALSAAAGTLAGVEVERATGRVGGGTLPLLELEGPVVAVRPRTGGVDRLQARLRSQRPPIVARAHERALLLDPRTMSDGDLAPVADGVAAALR
jgi:L-seryl-tRNA(Ser) seleniumtransferase